MPQMAPSLWLLIALFIFSLFMINTTITYFFNKKYTINQDLLKDSVNKMKWMW